MQPQSLLKVLSLGLHGFRESFAISGDMPSKHFGVFKSNRRIMFPWILQSVCTLDNFFECAACSSRCMYTLAAAMEEGRLCDARVVALV